MPKSKSKSKSKTSTKQSQRQKQQIVVNVNSNNKRKSTHYHHKNSNNAPSHIVVPSTNHHMMFMPQPQGLPQPQLLGDNNYGIGQARLLDPVIQRMNENIQQLQQNALNNSIQQDTLNDIQQRRNDRRYEQEQQFYRRNDYKSPSARGVAGAGAGYAYSTNVSEQASQNRARTLSVHSEDELRKVSQMHDLTDAERSVATDFLQRTLSANKPKEVHATVDTDAIIYHTEPSSMADLASGAFSGAIEPTPLQFNTPRKTLSSEKYLSSRSIPAITDELRNIVRGNTPIDGSFNPFRSAVKLSPFPRTLENHYERLAIEDAKPSEAANFGISSVEVKERENKLEVLRKAREARVQAQREKEEARVQAHEKEKEEKRVKDEDNQRRAREQEEQLKQLRELRHQQHQRAEKVASSKKFGSTDELISAYDEMNSVANGTSSEITPVVLKTYNKVRQAFGLHHVNRVANMELVKQFLEENRKLYNDIKMTYQPPTSIVPPTRFGRGTIVQGAELLSNRSQPKKIIIEEQGGGGAKQSRERK